MADAPYLGEIHLEEHWRLSGEPQQMIAFLGERGSPRRWHLFACACCWRILPLLTDERSRQAVSVAERLAEGLANRDEVRAAREEAELAALQAYQDRDSRRGLACMAAAFALTSPRRTAAHAAQATGRGAADERLAQCRLLRELFGDPFRPVVFEAGWGTPAVLAIAAHLYECEAWEEMPVLGDALEDAGCSAEQVLRHCREASGHLRGCWVVDGILGKR